jgi:hypothetical protein
MHSEFSFDEFHDVVCALPFVRQEDNGDLVCWSAEASGHNQVDLDRGQEYARIAVDIAKIFDMPVLIAMILRDMTLAGRFSGLEAGFIAGVSCAAKAGRMN